MAINIKHRGLPTSQLQASTGDGSLDLYLAGADDDVRQRKSPPDVTPVDVPLDTPITADDDTVVLKRRVGLLSGIALIVGTMIGSGIFVSPKGVLEQTQSVGLSLVVWAGCGILSLLGASCYVELGIAIPSSGGEYTYLLHSYPDLVAFFYAWTSIIIIRPAAFAIICMGLAHYAAEALYPACHNTPGILVKLFGITSIVLITFINCYSVKLATSIQNFFTAAKLTALAIIIISGLVNIASGKTATLATGFENTQTSPSSIALAFYSGLWAYDGWNNLNFATEEVKNPSRNLPLAILIGIPLVTIVYLLTNIAYLTTMTTDQLLASPAVAVTFGDNVLGVMKWIIPVSVAMSTFGACNGSAFSSGRLCYVAAREGHLVDVLSYVHVKRFTPAPALIFNAILAIMMVIPSGIEVLIDFFSFAAWLFYGLTVLALIILRFTNTGRNLDRPYKIPIIIPIIVFIVSIYLVLAPIIEDPAVEYLYATIFILSGLLFYVPFVYFRLHESRLKFVATFVDSLTVLLQMCLEISPSEGIPD